MRLDHYLDVLPDLFYNPYSVDNVHVVLGFAACRPYGIYLIVQLVICLRISRAVCTRGLTSLGLVV